MNRDPFYFVNTKPSGRAPQQRPDFDQLEAMELYCPECSRAVPVRKSLLLVLPEGDKYEYRCQYCGTTVGNKIDHSGQFQGILKA
jgi:hypothetical protein